MLWSFSFFLVKSWALQKKVISSAGQGLVTATIMSLKTIYRLKALVLKLWTVLTVCCCGTDYTHMQRRDLNSSRHSADKMTNKGHLTRTSHAIREEFHNCFVTHDNPDKHWQVQQPFHRILVSWHSCFVSVLF